jgi:hypothetical protein
MPQLETLGIDFHSPVSNRYVQRQLLDTPTMTHVALPNLRWFGFKGASAYLEALLPRMTTSMLEKLQVLFFHQLTYSIPHLVQFISTTENFTLSSARITFDEDAVFIRAYPYEGAKMYALYVELGCRPVDWQVASTAQISNALATVISAVDHLSLEYERYFISSEWNHEAERGQWREILRSFGNVKVLRLGVGDDFTRQLSGSLQIEDGESSMELLPELKELSYYAFDDDDDAFASFIDARQNCGYPVTLVRRVMSHRLGSPTESLLSMTFESTSDDITHLGR